MQDIINNIITKDLIEIIKTSRNKAFQKVNEVLIKMYWEIGEKLSKPLKMLILAISIWIVYLMILQLLFLESKVLIVEVFIE